MSHNNWKYIVMFAGAVCLACSLLVTGAAVVLKDRQDENALLDKHKKVLNVSGLIEPGVTPTAEFIHETFRDGIVTEIVNLESGDYVTDQFDNPDDYDQKRALNDPDASRAAESNRAGVARVPNAATVYRVVEESGETRLLVLPVEGKGLWSTLYGFLALDNDLTTIRGLTFYQHGETPGLGGEVDNPRWKGRWPDRKAFNEDWEPVIKVIKGPAPPPDEAPHEVDGLSGATITSNGVTHLLQFWLGDQGFGPYLARLRDEGNPS